MLVIFVTAALLSIMFLAVSRRPRCPSPALDTPTAPDVQRDPPVSYAPEAGHAASGRSQYESIVDNERFDPVLYDGPPVDVVTMGGPTVENIATAHSVQYESIVDNDDERFGPVLYDGPPVDVELVYGKPAYETLVESTRSIGGQAVTMSASMTRGIDETSRRVTVERIRGRSGPQYIVGFCHLRQERRTFRVDRIRKVAPVGAERAERDPSAYFRGLARSMLDTIASQPPPATLRSAGEGTVRVNRRDRKLKKQSEYEFFLGREQFDKDISASRSGRYLAGISDGNYAADEIKAGVALVDTATGVAPYVLRFRNTPRWPRVNENGLLLVREVGRDGAAILHAFDVTGWRRWGVALPTRYDLVEFAADGLRIVLVSGLFWRYSDSAVRTWVLVADTSEPVISLVGVEALRTTTDGHGEVLTPNGPVKFLSPDGLLERALSSRSADCR